MTCDDIIDSIINNEGRVFTNDAADRGGATKFGITAETLGEWRHLGHPATVDEVSELTEAEARVIYKQRYYEGPGLGQITSERLRTLVMDMLVNHGLRGGTLIIQRALKLPGDGVLGPKTIAALNVDADQSRAQSSHVFERVLAERIRFMGRLIERDPAQARFAAGWLGRCADFLAEG